MKTDKPERIFLIILFLFLANAESYSQPTGIRLKRMGTLDVSLEEDYVYGLFEANDTHLCWIKTSRIGTSVFFYNLQTAKTNKVALTQGRGPGEFSAIMGSVLLDKKLYLIDPKNTKLIPFMTDGKRLEDILLPLSTPMQAEEYKNDIIILDAVNPKQLIHSFNPKSETATAFDMGAIDPLKEFNKNPFYREGDLAVSGNNMVHLTKYLPFLYIYDIKAATLSKKIIFDDVEVQMGHPQTRSDGAQMMLPPAQVDVLSHHITSVPRSSSRVLLLVEGKSEDWDYDLSKLYEYDIEKEAFIGTHDLEVKATEVAVNDEYLFTYSEKKHKIYQYKISQ